MFQKDGVYTTKTVYIRMLLFGSIIRLQDNQILDTSIIPW